MKKTLFPTLAALSILMVCAAWVGYGNPFRTIPFSGAGDDYTLAEAFFIAECDEQGNCELAEGHERVLHFSFGDGVMGHPGTITGKGWNPVAVAHSTGLEFIPRADFIEATLKWCVPGEIWREHRWHGRHYIVELSSDPLETARCVQEQLPRGFSVYIADPMGRYSDRETFAQLQDETIGP